MTKCFSSQSQEISGVRLLQIFNKHDTLIPMVPSADAESIGILDFYDISWKFLEFFLEYLPTGTESRDGSRCVG